MSGKALLGALILAAGTLLAGGATPPGENPEHRKAEPSGIPSDWSPKRAA